PSAGGVGLLQLLVVLIALLILEGVMINPEDRIVVIIWHISIFVVSILLASLTRLDWDGFLIRLGLVIFAWLNLGAWNWKVFWDVKGLWTFQYGRNAHVVFSALLSGGAVEWIYLRGFLVEELPWV